jgi:hypothetical protein
MRMRIDESLDDAILERVKTDDDQTSPCTQSTRRLFER